MCKKNYSNKYTLTTNFVNIVSSSRKLDRNHLCIKTLTHIHVECCSLQSSLLSLNNQILCFNPREAFKQQFQLWRNIFGSSLATLGMVPNHVVGAFSLVIIDPHFLASARHYNSFCPQSDGQGWIHRGSSSRSLLYFFVVDNLWV